jgi:predicted small integral membrane protein
MLLWMAWTWQTAAFFAAIALMLAAMTALQVAWPTTARRGLMPIRTTRGDRLFVGLLAAAFIHLAWLGLTDLPLWQGSILAGLCFVVLMRWG